VLATPAYAAVQARVRARRAGLISADTWSRLLATGDAAQVRAIVAAHSPHSPHAPAAAGRPWGRGLQRSTYLDTLALAHSVPARAGELLRWYAGRLEVQDLKSLIRTLHHGRAYPAALAATVALDATPQAGALARVRTLAGLLEAVAGGPYGRALAQAWERYRREGRPFYLEVALDLAFGRGLVDRIEALGGRDRSDAEALLGRSLARTNLLAAARYRAMGVSPEEIVSFCLHRDFGGGLAMVQRIAAGSALGDEAAALGVELPTGTGESEARLELERATDRLQRAAAGRRFARSPFGVGLVLAYLIELEAEVADLIALVEARTQGLDAATVRRRVPRGVG
jgi:vacuolar-type H+-ATPase subunit C/Vma6